LAKKATKPTAKTGPSLAGMTAPKDEVERFHAAAEAFVKKATKSPKTALDTLVRMGIYTRSGRLTKNYSK